MKKMILSLFVCLVFCATTELSAQNSALAKAEKKIAFLVDNNDNMLQEAAGLGYELPKENFESLSDNQLEAIKKFVDQEQTRLGETKVYRLYAYVLKQYGEN